MRYAISKDFEFAAAHHLEGLPPEHKCARVHGHNYQVRVEISGPLDDIGFVLDYGDLSFIGDMLQKRFDHRDLNQVLFDVNPTAEHLAGYILAFARGEIGGSFSLAVGVSETPKVWAWCSE
jgi:6-pyruvoyltetrahydropterin/6-carboxytetrahydropterin synthase